MFYKFYFYLNIASKTKTTIKGSELIILDEHFHLRIGLIDHLGFLPLGNEDAVGR